MGKRFWKSYLGISFILWAFVGAYIGIHKFNSVALPSAIAVGLWGLFHGTQTVVWALVDRVYLERDERKQAIQAEAIRNLWDSDLSHDPWLDRDALREAISDHLKCYLKGRIKLRKP